MPIEPDRPEIRRPVKRGGRMASHAVVEEVAVWLEINRVPAVTWMCTPDMLEELAIGWLHGEGYIDSLDQVRLRPCATDLGFWAEIPEDLVAHVAAEGRRPVLASGCGAVATFLADPAAVAPGPSRGTPPAVDRFRELFKSLFTLGERYRETGGIHSAGLTDGAELLSHAEDIGRHNAVDKVVGAALLAGRAVAGHGLLVTGRISAELAYKAARAGIVYVATPSVPSSLAVEIAERVGMILVGRAVSGQPQLHGANRGT
ncbi:MAG TPA: formate dehydrogenase accessory sulfurtransferase FdhD [Gemmatimonadales bacterium]|nr:formate dehydrogenase accessory sulfurtransferase FdhD [Gemmatimonadales bacterium]